jgi:hypothetical protein
LLFNTTYTFEPIIPFQVILKWVNLIEIRFYAYFIIGINTCYQIFYCNMFVFACPIIAASQCWVFALKYRYLNLPKTLAFKWKLLFNTTYTFEPIIPFQVILKWVNLIEIRFYAYFHTSFLVLFDIFLKPNSKQNYLQVEQRQLF